MLSNRWALGRTSSWLVIAVIGTRLPGEVGASLTISSTHHVDERTSTQAVVNLTTSIDGSTLGF